MLIKMLEKINSLTEVLERLDHSEYASKNVIRISCNCSTIYAVFWLLKV